MLPELRHGLFRVFRLGNDLKIFLDAERVDTADCRDEFSSLDRL
jgi:hypothetical protein